MRIDNPAWIAECRCITRAADGTSRTLHLAIGRPYESDQDWACPVLVDGWFGRLVDISGIDAAQAQSLGAGIIRKLLADFVEKGGTLASEDGRPVELDTLLLALTPVTGNELQG